jgi:hypothetical protein
VISLLESSDDNSQHSEEEGDGLDGEEEAVCIEDADPSRRQAAAAQASAPDGLFVIDTPCTVLRG